MANFKARFDLEDRITQKLKAITKSAEQLRKSREQLNKPMMLKVKDEATRKISKVQREAEKVHRSLRKPYTLLVTARDRAMPVLQRLGRYAHTTLSKGYSFSVRAVDLATPTISRIASFTGTAIPKYRDFTIRAFDRATSIVSSVRRAILSIPSMVTVTLGIIGMGSFFKSTVGSSMRFEEYGVSMRHWLRGDEEIAQELMQWMGKKADVTPFTSADIFPAMTGAVALAGPKPDEIKRLTSMAIDMAALTPGATVEDAMLAIQNARMGELTMMKRFGFNITKRQLDKMGWETFLNEVEKEFSGGADALSRTLKGQINTLTGYAGSLFRSIGDGISDSLKPRIDSIVTWLMENEETWSSWKKTVMDAGREAGEWVFTRLEKGFNHIRTNYLENPEFQKLDIEGKIQFIAEDLGRWWNEKGKPIAEDIGIFVGKSIFKGIMFALQEGLKSIGRTWLNFFKDPSMETLGSAGIATAMFGSLASIILTPLIKGFSFVGKMVKGIYDIGKKGAKSFSREGKPPRGGGGGWFGGRGTGTARRIPSFLTGAGKFATRVPIVGTALSALSLFGASKGERAGILGGIGGSLTGASVGAAIGSVIPGVGTAIGGLAGGILGSLGGTKIGEWIGENFHSIRDTISETLFNPEWWSVKWDNVKNWAKQKLTDTAEWWESIKQTASETFFSAEWWIEKAGFIYGYLEATLFNGEWWSAKWDAVKAWTMEKWDAAVEVWNSITTKIDETLFNPEWWSVKWDSVKNWAFQKWETAVEIWQSIRTRIDETVFSSEWWSGKWDSVIGWIRSKWNSAVEIWHSVRNAIGSTLFSSEWWLGKWDQVIGWGKRKVKELKNWASNVWGEITSSFQHGREAGQSAARYADGGIIRRPHLGLVGEEGAEAIIPLSANKRTRALKLYEQVGKMLGVRQYAYGGIAGSSVLPKEQVASVISVEREKSRSTGGGKPNVQINFNGDNHYHDEMDAEKVANIALKAFKEVLEIEQFEGGEIVINV